MNARIKFASSLVIGRDGPFIDNPYRAPNVTEQQPSNPSDIFTEDALTRFDYDVSN